MKLCRLVGHTHTHNTPYARDQWCQYALSFSLYSTFVPISEHLLAPNCMPSFKYRSTWCVLARALAEWPMHYRHQQRSSRRIKKNKKLEDKTNVRVIRLLAFLMCFGLIFFSFVRKERQMHLYFLSFFSILLLIMIIIRSYFSFFQIYIFIYFFLSLTTGVKEQEI